MSRKRTIDPTQEWTIDRQQSRDGRVFARLLIGGQPVGGVVGSVLEIDDLERRLAQVSVASLVSDAAVDAAMESYGSKFEAASDLDRRELYKEACAMQGAILAAARVAGAK